jgi:curved DNA-binding protein CbpA
MPVPAPLVPDDDLYARLELGVDASPEAIELAWRALLKRHHPDVAGDDVVVLERAKRINVAHDWLADPALRARYDRDRSRGGSSAGSRSRGGASGPRSGRPERHAPRRSSGRPDLEPGDPAVRLARYLERVSRLTPDELDRLSVADPPPIAFLATIRRFILPDAVIAFAAAESALAARVARDRWASAGLREGLLGVAAEIVLAPVLDDLLAEPFRGRARERLLRAWEAAVDQPRYGPNGAEVAALRSQVASMTPAEIAAIIRASYGIPGMERPWPAALDRDEDEGLRVSALLAAADVAAALPDGRAGPAATVRARRLLGRLGHVVALRHAFPAAEYRRLVAPFATATGAGVGSDAPQERGGARPEVRRAR